MFGILASLGGLPRGFAGVAHELAMLLERNLGKASELARMQAFRFLGF